MSESAHIRSLDAVRQFAAAVVQFQSEARVCMAAFETQLNRVIFWLERDRPEFWKREIENCMREAADARVRLHQCRMRRIGDFRPSCIEEVKDLEKARRDLNFAQHQVPVVKRWRINALHEANEFHGRSAQLVQMLERELPRLVGLLAKSIERIETYAGTRGIDRPRTAGAISKLASEMQQELESDAEVAANADAGELVTDDVDAADASTPSPNADQLSPPDPGTNTPPQHDSSERSS